MNAIYARQSVDRADSISIESQIEFCQYEMRGEQYKVYTDRGYSGKNTDRPAFAEMMNDIESGVIGKVVVYKLDRISRSILDFSNMMEKFGKHRVEFVSTTEKFDTSSPMGRAMLNICIVFAQLERETIQKRVADAYYSRSQKSFYMGGRVPYALVDKHYSTTRSRYLLCSNKMNSKACEGPGTIYTDEFEQIIYNEMRKKMAQFKTLRRCKGNYINPELTALNVQLTQVETEIGSLMDRLSAADDTLFRYISGRVKELDGKKQELMKRISELKLHKEADYTEIYNHLTMWDELSFDDKRQTVDQLIRVIYATSDSIKIEWRI